MSNNSKKKLDQQIDFDKMDIETLLKIKQLAEESLAKKSVNKKPKVNKPKEVVVEKPEFDLLSMLKSNKEKREKKLRKNTEKPIINDEPVFDLMSYLKKNKEKREKDNKIEKQVVVEDPIFKTLMQQREVKRHKTIISKFNRKQQYVYKFESYEKIAKDITTVYNLQDSSFKMNISFNYQLKNSDGEIKNYYAHSSDPLYDNPVTMRNATDLNRVTKEFSNYTNILDHIVNKRPDTKWYFYKMIGYDIYVYKMDFTIGAPVSLPLYLVNTNHVYGLHQYDDNLCFWRCLAIKKENVTPDRCSRIAKQLFTNYYGHKNYEKYPGLNINKELEKVEKYFDVNVNIYSQDKKDVVKLYRRSLNKQLTTMYVNLYKNHFSYIKDIDKYGQTYACHCGKIFKSPKLLNRHMTTCTDKVKFVYTGGNYEVKNTIFEDMQKDFPTLKIPNRFHDYFICFDFEAYVQPITRVKTQNQMDGLDFGCLHKPASVSVCSNIEGYKEPICIIDYANNTQSFINEWLAKLIEISKKSCKLMCEKFKYVFDILKEDDSDDLKLKKRKKYHQEKLWKFCKQTPVLGFNSAGYDTNLIKDHLFLGLKNIEDDPCIIKQGSRYKSVSNSFLKFLDVLNYLAPCKYKEFLKAYNCKDAKGSFPYRWFDNSEKLYATEIPSAEYFDDDGKDEEDAETKEQKREKAVAVWKSKNMKYFYEYLKYYNDLDVVPFVEAVERMFEFYRTKDLDIFIDAISLPGLVTKFLFKMVPEDVKFSLLEEKDKDLYKTFRKAIVGGPSIVFRRYHEVNKTKIRNGEKLCKKVIGFDANALYLKCISQEMPSGPAIRNGPEDSLNPKTISKNILNGSLFGFVEVDIKVPDNLKEKFAEMPPIFKNETIEFKDIGEHMQNFYTSNNIKYNKSGKLISSMFGNKILLYTPLLKWYLEHGLVITKVYQYIKYIPTTCFQEFADAVSDARRAGDTDKNLLIIGNTMKTIGNSAYGKMITNKEKHITLKYVGEDKISKQINSRHFKDCIVMGKDDDVVYEVSTTKSKIKVDLPTQIGIAVYTLAKLRMLEFYYDLLDKYLDRSDFEYCQMDTDSAYIAFSDPDWESLIKPELREQYYKEKTLWFPRSDTKENINYDKRTPGLFKEEFRGDYIYALCAEMYCVGQYNGKEKLSSKGIQQRNNILDKQRYHDVLFNSLVDKVTNTGFRSKDNTIYSYTQHKQGLTYKYDKRKVLEDGISTTYLDI